MTDGCDLAGGSYPKVDREMVELWSKAEAHHAMKEHDADEDSHLDAGEVAKAHDSIWYMTHPPDMRDEL